MTKLLKPASPHYLPLLRRRRRVGTFGGGGGGGLPSSTTNFVAAPNNMTFSGGNIQSIEDEVTGDGGIATLINNLAGDNTDGLIMTELTGGARINFLGATYFNDPFPSGAHLAIAHRRSAVADTETMILAGDSSSRFIGAGQSGSTAVAADQMAFTGYRFDLDTADSVPNRGQIWTQVFSDTDLHVSHIIDLSFGANMSPCWYQLGGFRLEGRIFGWARYTDKSESADISQRFYDLA